MGESTTPLEDWIRLVIAKRPYITAENQLDAFVWSKVQPVAPEGGSLLEILGYGVSDVSYQEKIPRGPGGYFWQPDFILRRNNKPVAIIEDKAPREELGKHTEQMLEYFRKVPAPIGMLFNGDTARLLVNTTLAELVDLRDGLECEWVAEAEMSDRGSMIELIERMSVSSLASDALGVARRLAENRLRDKRQEDIASRLQAIMEEPDDGILDAIIRTDSALSALNATLVELRDAWVDKSVLVPPPPPTTPGPRLGGINPTLRYKIAQLCRSFGWAKTSELLATSNIRRLNIREDGKEIKGYKRVGTFQEVPDGLCVQGVDGAAGEAIIEELDKLLAGSTKDGQESR